MVDFEPRARRTFPELVKKFMALDSIDLLTHLPGELAEEAEWEMSLKQAKASDAAFRSPTILLSAGLRPDLGLLEGMFREEQQRWAMRKSNVTFRVVSRSPSARREQDTVDRLRPERATATASSKAARSPSVRCSASGNATQPPPVARSFAYRAAIRPYLSSSGSSS